MVEFFFVRRSPSRSLKVPICELNINIEYVSQHRHKNDKIKMENLLLKKNNLLRRGLSQSVSRWVGGSVDRWVGAWVGRLVGQSVGQLVGRLVGWSVGRSLGRSVGRSVSQSVSQNYNMEYSKV